MARTFVDGKVHVRRNRCSTCIFHDNGYRMHLAEGRVEAMVAEASAGLGSAIQCHKHLYQGAEIEPVCRGFFDLRVSTVLRLAELQGVVAFVGDDGTVC